MFALKASFVFRAKIKTQNYAEFIYLKVNFNMRGIEIGLFSDALREIPLAKFQLLRVEAAVAMRSDQSLDVDFRLGELSLYDKRLTHQDGVTHLIGPRWNAGRHGRGFAGSIFQGCRGAFPGLFVYERPRTRSLF